MSWYTKGTNNLPENDNSGGGDGAGKIGSLWPPKRIWMPKNSQREIVFVDDDSFNINEHNPKMDGHWKNWLTCVKGVYDPAVCCELLEDAGYKRYLVGMFTVVDTDEWTSNKGVQYQYEVKLLPAKYHTLQKLAGKKEDSEADGRTMAGSVYRVKRYDNSKSPSCGDDFDFRREADMAKLFTLARFNNTPLSELWDDAEKDPELRDTLTKIFNFGQLLDDEPLPRKIVPFNYLELLKPKSPDEVKAFLGATGGSLPNGGSGDLKDDDIPF